MVTFIASILIFSLIILFHELGHYKAAKSVGIKIEEFAIGMGPVIHKINKEGTIFSIRAFPIGGYVKMEGEDEDICTSTSFGSKSVMQRFKVIVAGPLMNFALAIVLFIITASFFGVAGNKIEYIDNQSTEYEAGIRANDRITRINNKKVYIWEDIAYELSNQTEMHTIEIVRNDKVKTFNVEPNFRNLIGISPQIKNEEYTTILGNVDTNMPAYKSGIRVGDKIVKINNINIENWDELRNVINSSKSNELLVSVIRDNKPLDFSVIPQKQVVLSLYTATEKSLVSVIVSSIYKTVYYIKLMFYFIFMLITGQVGSEAVAGPVGVINMVGEAAKVGIQPLLNLAAFISINLGFINLLPIPALDGSRLFFLIIEGIRKKKIPQEKEGFVHFIGFAFLITLMIIITFKDVINLIK